MLLDRRDVEILIQGEYYHFKNIVCHQRQHQGIDMYFLVVIFLNLNISLAQFSF